MLALGTKSIHTKQVKHNWESLVKQYGSEVTVLLDTELNSIEGVDPKVKKAIRMFREGRVRVTPGGGGQYGKIEIVEDDETLPVEAESTGEFQRSLLEY